MTLQYETPTIATDHERRWRRGLIYFGLVYFSQGISQLVTLLNQPLRNYLKAQGFDASATADFFFVAMIPWMLKPAYGLISDFFPLFGYRRKSYLLMLNCAAALAFLSVIGIRDPKLLLIAMFMTGLGVAASDVIVDALMVETGQETGKTRTFQGVQWACLQGAAVLSGVISIWITSRWANDAGTGLSVAALICMCVPMVVAMMTWFFVIEPKSKANVQGFLDTGYAFVKALFSWRLWFIVLFLCLVNFNPGPVTPLYDFLEQKRGFTRADLSIMDTASSVGGVLGAIAFMALLSNRLSTKWTVAVGITASALGLLPLAFIDGRLDGMISYALYGGTWTIATLCFLTLAAEACPRRIEAFVFAGLMAINNLSVQYSDVLGARLYQGRFNGEVKWLIVLSAGITLAGLVLVPFLPRPANKEPELRGFEVIRV